MRITEPQPYPFYVKFSGDLCPVDDRQISHSHGFANGGFLLFVMDVLVRNRFDMSRGRAVPVKLTFAYRQ